MSPDPSEQVARYMRGWQKLLKRKPTNREKAAMLRASELATIADGMRLRVLTGTASADDLIRCDNASRRAARDAYAALPRPKPSTPTVPPLADLIAAARMSERAGA